MAYCGCLEQTQKKGMAGNQTCKEKKHSPQVNDANHYAMTAGTLSKPLDVL
jgi:hypothetical protein